MIVDAQYTMWLERGYLTRPPSLSVADVSEFVNKAYVVFGIWWCNLALRLVHKDYRWSLCSLSCLTLGEGAWRLFSHGRL